MPVGETIVVVCACGKRLKAPATSVGRKARCPQCGGVLTVKAAAAPPPMPALAKLPGSVPRRAAAVVPPSGDDGLGALYELAEQANAAAPAVERARCPKCKAGMDGGAVVCMHCGYDTRTGRAVGTITTAKSSNAAGVVPYATPARAGKKPVDYMAPTGSFGVGLAMSAAFAAAASLVWIGVALVTGFTIGYIAVLIGGAAGAGMKVGQKGFSKAGGAAAAGITLVAILAAKLAVLECVLARHHLNVSVLDLNGAKLGFYFFSPIGVIIMLVGMGAAFRTANASISG